MKISLGRELAEALDLGDWDRAQRLALLLAEREPAYFGLLHAIASLVEELEEAGIERADDDDDLDDEEELGRIGRDLRGRTEAQDDGRACVLCGDETSAKVPTGERGSRGAQLFRCSPACARRTTP